MPSQCLGFCVIILGTIIGLVICTKPEQPPQEKNGEQASSSDSTGETADDKVSSWQLSSIQQGKADPTATIIANIKTRHFFIAPKGSLIRWLNY